MSKETRSKTEAPKAGSNGNVPNAVKALKLEQSEAAEIEQKRELLIAKHKTLSTDLASLKVAAVSAESAKTKALSLFAIDGISRREMDQARDAYEQVVKKISNITELLQAVDNERQKIEASIPKQYQRIDEAKKAFWRAVFEHKREGLRANVNDDLPLALTALGYSGNYLRLEDQLGAIFGIELSPDDRKALATRILEEHSLLPRT